MNNRAKSQRDVFEVLAGSTVSQYFVGRCLALAAPWCPTQGAPQHQRLQPGIAMAEARARAGSRAQRAAAAEAREKVEALCDADGGGVFGDIILRLLDDPADLQRAMSVSKKWRGFAGHDLVWQRFCQPYPMLQLLQTRTGSSYRTLFCQRKLAEHRCREETARTLSRTDYMLGLEVYDHAGNHVLTKLEPLPPEPRPGSRTGDSLLAVGSARGPTFVWPDDAPVQRHYDQQEALAETGAEALYSVGAFLLRLADNKCFALGNSASLGQQYRDGDTDWTAGDHWSAADSAVVQWEVPGLVEGGHVPDHNCLPDHVSIESQQMATTNILARFAAHMPPHWQPPARPESHMMDWSVYQAELQKWRTEVRTSIQQQATFASVMLRLDQVVYDPVHDWDIEYCRVPAARVEDVRSLLELAEAPSASWRWA
eukprot:COSAG06_NODE_129_length_22602_cov_7.116318_27_plen_426_part_00